MKKNGKPRKNLWDQYYKKMLLAFCGISLVVVVAAVFTISAISVRGANQKHEEYLRNRVQDTQNDFDYTIKAMRESYYYLINTPSVNEFLYRKTRENPVIISQTDLVARQLNGMHPYLHSMHLYNQYTEQIISEGNVNAMKEQFFADSWKRPSCKTSLNLFYAQMKSGAASEPVRTLSIFFQNSSVSSLKGHSGIVMTLDRDGLERWMSESLDGTTLIVDEEGEVVFATGDVPVECLEAGMTKEIQGAEEGAKSFRCTCQGRKLFATAVKSELTGLYLVNFEAGSQLQEYMAIVAAGMSLLAIGAMVLLFLISYLLSRRLYRPVDKVVKLVRGSRYGAKPDGSEDEVSSLYQVFHEALLDIDSLESQKEAAYIQEIQHWTRKILSGRITEGMNRYPESILNRPVHLFILCMRIDSYMNYDMNAQAAYEKTLRKMIPDCLNEMFRCEVTDMKNGELAVLVNYRDEKAHDVIQLAEDLEDLKKQIVQKIGITVTIGIGGEADSWEACAACYGKASGMADYRFLLGGGTIYSQEHLETLIVEGGRYPSELEAKLSDAIRRDDRAAFESVLHDIIGMIRRYTYAKASSILIQLIASCMKTMNQITQSEDLNYDLELARLDTVFRSMERIENVEKWILHLFDEYSQVVQHIQKMKDKRYYNIIEDAKTYVREHISDYSLNVEELARQSGYTSYYFSRIFKEITGSTPLDYIRRERIEKAKELLLRPGIKVADVPELAGYNNASSFYSVFKKIVGMTPASYQEFMNESEKTDKK